MPILPSKSSPQPTTYSHLYYRCYGSLAWNYCPITWLYCHRRGPTMVATKRTGRRQAWLEAKGGWLDHNLGNGRQSSHNLIQSNILRSDWWRMSFNTPSTCCSLFSLPFWHCSIYTSMRGEAFVSTSTGHKAFTLPLTNVDIEWRWHSCRMLQSDHCPCPLPLLSLSYFVVFFPPLPLPLARSHRSPLSSIVAPASIVDARIDIDKTDHKVIFINHHHNSHPGLLMTSPSTTTTIVD